MREILSKLLWDFRHTKVKGLLMIFAAGLSVWGISSVLYSYEMAERDFRVNFSRTFPADIELVIDDYQTRIEDLLLADPNVIDLERREIIGGKIMSRNGDWMPFVLFGVDVLRNMRLDVFRVRDTIGDNPKVLIEQNARFFLPEEQDSIIVQFPKHDAVMWKIGGTSHDARLAPARMERTVFAHATSLDLLQPYLEEGRRRLLVETNVSDDEQRLWEVGQRLIAIGKTNGSPIQIISIPKPGKHIHQNIVDGISFLQISSGLLLALMGVVLLSLILLTWIFPQVPDIGTMKALGASTRAVLVSYLLVFMAIVTAGLVIGIPLGHLTAVKYNGMIAYIQNFEPVEEATPLPVHLLVVLISFSVPLLFALRPLRRASSATVREAMNGTFFSVDKLFRAHTFLSTLNSKLTYVLNNLFRTGTRSLLLILLMAVGTSLFFTGTNLDFSVRRELAYFARNATYELRVRFSEELENHDVAFLDDLSFVQSRVPLKDVPVTYQPPSVVHTQTTFVRILSTQHHIPDDFVIKGELKKDCGNCLYISGEGMRQKFAGTTLGTVVDLTFPSGETKPYIYSGIFKDLAAIGAPFFLFDDGATQTFNALALDLKPGVSSAEVRNAVDDALLAHGIDMAGMLDVNMRMGQLVGHLEPTFTILKISGLITILLSLLGLIIVLDLCIRERTRELGVMRAMGGSYKFISGLFQMEFLIATILAVLMGIIASIPLTDALCTVLTETVIYHYIPAGIDLFTTGLTVLILLVLQTICIVLFNYWKIRSNTHSLLNMRI